MNVILLSGGIDSAVLLAHEIKCGRAPGVCVTFDYGQRQARPECDAARRVATYYGVRHAHYNFPYKPTGNCLTDPAMRVPVNLPVSDTAHDAAIIPNRNLILVAAAAGYTAWMGRVDEVVIGVHKSDQEGGGYPDCKPAFVEAADKVLKLSCGAGVRAPLADCTKKYIIEYGRRLKVPFDLTWSCFNGGPKPCGQCVACQVREKALATPELADF